MALLSISLKQRCSPASSKPTISHLHECTMKNRWKNTARVGVNIQQSVKVFPPLFPAQCVHHEIAYFHVTHAWSKSPLWMRSPCDKSCHCHRNGSYRPWPVDPKLKCIPLKRGQFNQKFKFYNHLQDSPSCCCLNLYD